MSSPVWVRPTRWLSDANMLAAGYALGRHAARRYPSAATAEVIEIIRDLTPRGLPDGTGCTRHARPTCHRSLQCHVEVSLQARYLDHPVTRQAIARGVASVRAVSGRG